MKAEVEFVLFVKNQQISSLFYTQLFNMPAILNVPGMTEFQLSDNTKLGLMPETGIAQIICPPLPNPSTGSGIPRCELYLKVDDPEGFIDRGLINGAKLVSPFQARDWGDSAGYLSDPDGHVIAFAK